MKLKLIKQIENKIIIKWHENNKEGNNFSNKFYYEDDVIIFAAPNLENYSDLSIPDASMPLLIAVNSLLNNTKNKAHILFSENQIKEFNFYNSLFNSFCLPKNSSRLKLEIISKKELKMISDFKRTKRAKKIGQLNDFANLTFFCINKKLYKNIIISHNDLVFHKWSDDYILKKDLINNDFISFSGKISIKNDEDSFEKLSNGKISNWINFDKELFLNKQIHSSLLAASDNFCEKFSMFFNKNYNKWIDEQDDYKFIEQEIISIFLYSTKFKENNLKKILNDKEGKYFHSKKEIKLWYRYIHYDFNKKGLQFIREAKNFNNMPYGLKILYSETIKIFKML